MGLGRDLKIELYKLKHTGFWVFQVLYNLGVLLLTVGILTFYRNKGEAQCIQLLYDVSVVLLPLISSIAVALLLNQEEQIGNLFGVLFVQNRKRLLDAKMLFVLLAGNIGIVLNTFFFVIFVSKETLIMWIGFVIGYLLFEIVFYTFHLFLNIKFGMTISVFWGIFEFLQMIIYTNIRLQTIFRWIPFAWVIEWKQDWVDHVIQGNAWFWISCILLTGAFWMLVRIWFQQWEGRKNTEE